MRRVAPLLLLCFSVAAQAGVVEYLYVEPNEGTSSGGHVALRLGDTVYDYQNADLDTLRLRRAPYQHFRYAYSVRENRTIHVSRLELSDEARESLRERFNRRYLVQEKHFSELRSLQQDLALVRALRAPEPDPRVPLRGAGFFYAAGSAGAAGRSAVLASLRKRVEQRHGEDWLQTRALELEARVQRLAPEAPESGVPVVSEDDHPGGTYHFSDRYSDLLSKLLALRALDESRALRPEVRHAPTDPEFRLTPAELDGLQRLTRRLEDRLIRLFASRRPDWGYAALLGMARLEVLQASLRSGRLVFLDGFGPDAMLMSAETVQQGRVFVQELLERTRADFADAKLRLASAAEPDESDLARLSEFANRSLELQRGLRDGRAVRMQSEILVPEARAGLAGLPTPQLDVGELPLQEAAVARREADYRRALGEAFAYRLLSRNCATQLLATLDVELRDVGSERALLDFVPVLSQRSVVGAYRAERVGEVPSYRRTRLAEMYQRENDLLVFLRESNTLTSEIYRANPQDSAFLFFSEGTPLLRPLFGALNLSVSVGELGLGLVRLPFDRGRMLWSGARGAVFSLPELAFVSLRKGTLVYGPGDPPRTALAAR